MSVHIYIAARFSRRPEANALANKLKALGHTIVSRWVKPDSDHVAPTGLSKQAADDERRRFAQEDFDDLCACDMIVSLQEEPRNNSRGGRHVEFGMALALGKKVVCIGPRETVFHHLPQVRNFSDEEQFLIWMAS
jgi:nucleoside 2-deoxyribosyltransferase